mgnify:FL=1
MRYLFIISLFSYFSIIEAALSISITGNPSTMTINSGTAGQNPNPATNSSRTYSVSTDTTIRKITGKINSSMPSGVTLAINLAAPTGATSLGSVAMTTTIQDLVTGIPIFTISSGRTMTYTLSATASAAAVTNNTRTVTYTVQ